MWSNLKVSFYDLLGYFFPGAIFTIALLILFCAVFFPSVFVFPFTITNAVAGVLLAIAYLAGHLVQAIANKVCPSPPRIAETMKKLPNPIKTALRDEVSSAYGLKSAELDNDWILRLSQAAFTRIGILDNWVIYEAREGFYRGLFISFAALSVALFARALAPGEGSRSRIPSSSCTGISFWLSG